MAMKQVMTIEKARALANTVTLGMAKYGSQYSPAYATQISLEAIAVLNGHANFDGPTKEDLTKVNRQLTACQAREAGLKKKQAAAE